MKIRVKATQFECEAFGFAGLASISFGETFFIRSIMIMKGKDGTRFVSFPSKKAGDKYKEICNPINKEFREKLVNALMESLDKKEAVEFDDGKDGQIVITAYPCEGDKGKVGEAKIYINDNFVISGISIYETKNNAIYPRIPGYKTLDLKPDGAPVYEQFCEVRKGVRKVLKQAIIDEYLMAKKNLENGKENISIKSKIEESKKKVSANEITTVKKEELER